MSASKSRGIERQACCWCVINVSWMWGGYPEKEKALIVKREKVPLGLYGPIKRDSRGALDVGIKRGSPGGGPERRQPWWTYNEGCKPPKSEAIW